MPEAKPAFMASPNWDRLTELEAMAVGFRALGRKLAPLARALGYEESTVRHAYRNGIRKLKG